MQSLLEVKKCEQNLASNTSLVHRFVLLYEYAYIKILRGTQKADRILLKVLFLYSIDIEHFKKTFLCLWGKNAPNRTELEAFLFITSF